MKKQTPFKISTGLKNLIGQDLITEEFVAVFELVKNSFDAHASLVQIFFEDDRIVVCDNGKGMSNADIHNKWLFVAYSAKRDGTEDDNYRDKVSGPRRSFAGAKGVGRFSSDRLGKHLLLCSKAAQHPVQHAEIDWTLYEVDAKKEFRTIKASVWETSDFPASVPNPQGKTGTVLEISGLRSEWDRKKLQRLKRELTKLINPFAEESTEFEIEIIAPDQRVQDKEDAKFNADAKRKGEPRLIVNGLVKNPILDVLGERTTLIRVALVNKGEMIESVLEDRGELIYRIREPNPYSGIKESGLLADIYFLNRSAKAVFARRMGLPSVQFGSIFLFRNGFRVMPIGAEDDDFFGLNRRKQQGQRRFLGGRDLIGRVDIAGGHGFEEATSRNHGLIRTPEVAQMIECVRDKCVRRLERYVVDISWKDFYDKDVADISRMKLDESSALVAQLVSRLAATQGVELVAYNRELVRIVDEKSAAFENSLKALELLAERTGDKAILSRVDEAKARIRSLESSQKEAVQAARRAESRAEAALDVATTAKIELDEEKKRNRFLVAATSLDEDTTLNLHHQIIMHASDVHLGVKRMMGKLRKNIKVPKREWVDFLERVSFRNSQILTASRFATKSGYKQQSAEVQADLAGYIRDYIETVTSLWAPRGVKIEVSGDEKPLERTFRPIEVGILIDNLVSNAAKAHASKVGVFLQLSKGSNPELTITVADDGDGWSQALEPLEQVLEKGVTTTNGAGLGLYHIRQVIEGLGGLIDVHREPESDNLPGAKLVLRIPS
ncbi:MAG: ATP-binding protein [Gammaproteobacteria bacterium]|nr:ATP-binding protein [Gammaproteobacteria bacterium]